MKTKIVKTRAAAGRCHEPAGDAGGAGMSVDDASVRFEIGGLPVQLVLPKRDMDLVALLPQAAKILQGGRDNE